MKIKRILSVLLIATMLLSAFSVVSFAKEKNEIDDSIHTHCMSVGTDFLAHFTDSRYNIDDEINFYCSTDDDCKCKLIICNDCFNKK